MRIFQLAMFCIFLLLTFSCGQKKAIKRLDNTGIDSTELANRIENLLDTANVHGMALTIFNENKIVYKNTFGYKRFDEKSILTDSTNIYGASLSKAVFGVLVMKLVEEDVIDLDIPLQDYLDKPIYQYKPLTRWHDNYADLKSDTLYHKITARVCLSHTTGFPNWRWEESDQKLKVRFEPGSRYSYSGEGFTYLQVVIEKVVGKNLEELAQEKIFQPLGMTNTSYKWNSKFEKDFAFGHAITGAIFEKDKDNEPRGASTLETTLVDYSTFLEAVLQKKILTSSSWHELFQPQIRIYSIRQFGPLSLKDSTLNDNIKLSYGLGWGLLDSPYGLGAFKEGHGEGFQHYSILYPEAGKGILIMTNSDNGESVFKELLEMCIADTYTPSKWNNYVPYQDKKTIPDSLYGYQCSPCNVDCDTLSFENPGKCPNCSMKLIPKISMLYN